MPLSPGTRIGPYEVTTQIGAGGMGEVYRARDAKLNRDVAIKVLPSAVAGDVDRLARFQREAQLLAALNHPNIAHIYGLEGQDESFGLSALVMELVEGETLSDRLAGGPLEVPEAIEIARQIALGLEAAHTSNVVHRDLKPANVKVRRDGVVKILDFGLAKTLTAPPVGDVSQTPTMTSPAMLTNSGVVLGTAAYMSPEQARGRPVSTRTDVWAFGCVLYEMLTGRSAFGGPTVPEALARVLERDPDWSALPNATPARLRLLLGRCLQKDPAKRLPDIGDARRELEELTAQRPFVHLTMGAAKTIPAAVALLAVAGVIAYVWLRPAPRRVTDRSEWVQLTNLDSATQPALSPDGKVLAFIRGQGTFTTDGQIYVKLLPTGEPIPLTNDMARKMSPAFSRDGSQVAYTVRSGQRGELWDTWIVGALRGEPRQWHTNASGLTWIDRNRLLFSKFMSNGSMRIVTSTESRTDERDVYVPNSTGMAHRSYLSPDANSVAIVEMGETGAWLPCRVVPLSGGTPGEPIGPHKSRCTVAAWSPDQQWIYMSADAGDGFHLWRQRFPGGQPEQLTSGPTQEEGIALAPDGQSVITSMGLRLRSLWIHDAAGDRQISLEGYALLPIFSPDGQRLYYRTTSGADSGVSVSELWLADITTGRAERVLPGLKITGYSVSGDGRVLAAVVEEDGKTRLWIASADGRTPPHRIEGAEGDMPGFGPSGVLLFRPSGTGAIFRTRDDGSDRQRVSDVGVGTFPTVSPDGQWFAVEIAAELRVYSLDGKQRILVRKGGGRLRWAPDGQHVYLNTTTADASGFAVGTTYVLPLPAGSMLPRVPNGGFISDAELRAQPGVQIIPYGDVTPGPTAGVYAFSRVTTTRNLYRIPLP